LARLPPSFDLALEALGAHQRLVQLLVVVVALGQERQRGVVDDPVEPAAQVADLGISQQRRPGVEERLLEDVLRATVWHQPPRVGGERATVALDDHRERLLVARARQPHQALVGLGTQHQG
jgi:hypothetical protein